MRNIVESAAMNLVGAALYAAGGYFAIGAVVALAFVVFGISRVDHAAQGSSIAFRALVFPGSAALWPLVLFKWLKGKPA